MDFSVSQLVRWLSFICARIFSGDQYLSRMQEAERYAQNNSKILCTSERTLSIVVAAAVILSLVCYVVCYDGVTGFKMLPESIRSSLSPLRVCLCAV